MAADRKVSSDQVLYRSGTAARRAQVPVTTLRVWERRYGVTDALRSASGQRLYTEEDVDRLKRVKLLVNRGYAISTVARLSREQLEQLPVDSRPTTPRLGTLRWSLVGSNLAQRVERWRVGPSSFRGYKDLAAAAEHLASEMADIVIIHSPSLLDDTAARILALKDKSPAIIWAVIYTFGVSQATQALSRSGIRLIRDPITRVQFEQLTDDLAQSAVKSRPPGEAPPSARKCRRFSEEDLEVFERHAAAVRCECPTHLMTLIQLSGAFETYSDGCVSKDSQQSALHRYLGDVANQAVTLFETALERIAAEEKIPIKRRSGTG